MDRVKDKVIIVTGGAMGIGQATCLLLAKEGASVAVADLSAQAGEETAAQIVREGGQAAFWNLDVTREENVRQVMAEIAARFGRIDVLVNNAGISGTNKPTHEISEEEWDLVFDVNLKGVFFCTKHAIPFMQKAGGGSIINLSSIYGIIGAADAPPYHASKGAVRAMSKNDAMLYAKDHIRVNSVHPGFIWTPMVEQFSQQQPIGAAEFRAALDALHPIGHVGEPMDIAWGILYLASDESKFVTGSELVIDGGYLAR